MQIELITLRFSPELDAFDDGPLRQALDADDRTVLDVREHYFEVGGSPRLACLLTFAATSASPPARRTRERSERDPARSLPPEQRALYQQLRAWRSSRAQAEGVPTYVVANNRELVALVTTRPDSVTALQSIEGFGPAKSERYGEELIALLHSEADA